MQGRMAAAAAAARRPKGWARAREDDARAVVSSSGTASQQAVHGHLERRQAGNGDSEEGEYQHSSQHQRYPLRVLQGGAAATFCFLLAVDAAFTACSSHRLHTHLGCVKKRSTRR